ncbi:hypothetical protein Tcan_07900 [Toxocara canis]|uniref:Uncharacterized protein n=2 Tax=Toxocara canis TaxID=6265 RepID=A0A0B2VNE8_TOXCA|nr:hypothetical protein Tcan_07900 [Toxocara canis]VDM23867.1 unnamed protein product [Toxocara canis]
MHDDRDGMLTCVACEDLYASTYSSLGSKGKRGSVLSGERVVLHMLLHVRHSRVFCGDRTLASLGVRPPESPEWPGSTADWRSSWQRELLLPKRSHHSQLPARGNATEERCRSSLNACQRARRPRSAELA